ncbi:MAG: T9SS type A sorting domain-containing protein, partial [Chitinophagaceae bacterium]|nr:T9SS type A sorting domain-containing protein [Chitinophagaceae bacterium]
VIPENNTFTGGIPNNIYLGYGPQRVTLRANATGGTSYTYTWRAVSGNGTISSTNSSQPVFAPTAAGNYTFEVSVRTQSGCVSVSRVTICVRDIRVKDTDDDKCDHKSHSSKDCKHGKHNHGKCDHKSHSKDKCKDKYDDGDDDKDDCDHKSHDKKDCKHKGHKHSSCDHKSHHSSACKNKYNDKYDDDHDDDDDDDDVYKVYLCHVPPGNSGNPQTLKISVNAVAAHLSNHSGDRLGSCADQGCVETPPPPPTCSSSITVVPENNVFTGGVPSNIYLGYGPQRVTLQANATGGTGYTYSWRSIAGGGSLNNTTSAQPVFSPSREGYYTFEVRVTTQAGCTSTSQVNICVQDIRVEDDCNDWNWSWNWWSGNSQNSSNSKVYITRRNGNSNNFRIMEVKVSDVAAHLQNNPNDRLGKGLNGCVSNAVSSTVISGNQIIAITNELPTVSNGKIIAPSNNLSELDIKVMGNPSRSFFTIQMTSKHELPIQVRIFDINGRPVESKANQLPNSTIQIGHNLGSGTYYAEFLQGSKRKVIQLIKVR